MEEDVSAICDQALDVFLMLSANGANKRCRRLDYLLLGSARVLNDHNVALILFQSFTSNTKSGAIHTLRRSYFHSWSAVYCTVQLEPSRCYSALVG